MWFESYCINNLSVLLSQRLDILTDYLGVSIICNALIVKIILFLCNFHAELVF